MSGHALRACRGDLNDQTMVDEGGCAAGGARGRGGRRGSSRGTDASDDRFRARAAAGARSAKPEARKAPAPLKASAGWVMPKTPWGHPDLQGVWTTDDMLSVPMERPEQFAGRAELTDEEFGVRARRETRRRSSATGRAVRGVPRRRGLPDVPADITGDRAGGRPHSADHARSAAARGDAPGATQQRALVVGRSDLLRPLHHARANRLHHAGNLRQRQPDPPDARLRRHQLRDGARGAPDSARRPPSRRPENQAPTSATRAATGRATRWSSRRPTSSTTGRASASTAAARRRARC